MILLLMNSWKDKRYPEDTAVLVIRPSHSWSFTWCLCLLKTGWRSPLPSWQCMTLYMGNLRWKKKLPPPPPPPPPPPHVQPWPVVATYNTPCHSMHTVSGSHSVCEYTCSKQMTYDSYYSCMTIISPSHANSKNAVLVSYETSTDTAF